MHMLEVVRCLKYGGKSLVEDLPTLVNEDDGFILELQLDEMDRVSEFIADYNNTLHTLFLSKNN